MIKFLRRRRLGRTSVHGMIGAMTAQAEEVRTWVGREYDNLSTTDLVVRWGCTANLHEERNGFKVLNTARAIHQVNDKAGFRSLLMEKAPDLIPETQFNHHFPPDSDAWVVRPRTHSRGRDLYYTDDIDDLEEAASGCGEGYYISEYIQKVAEYRVFVVQGRAVAVAQKTPGNPDDVAWNVAQGGRFDNVSWDNWPLQAVRKSIEAFNLTELDFGGVDVMIDGDGRAYVIEINSAPSLTSEYRQQCMAKAFDWIVTYGKQRIPLLEERGGYRKFIHPAVCDRAVLVEPSLLEMTDELSDEDMDEINSGEILGESMPVNILEQFTDVELINEMNRRELR